jgi:hypothetical protein
MLRTLNSWQKKFYDFKLLCESANRSPLLSSSKLIIGWQPFLNHLYYYVSLLCMFLLFMMKFSRAISRVKWLCGEKNVSKTDEDRDGLRNVGFFTAQPFDPADSPRDLHHAKSPGKQQISFLTLCFKFINYLSFKHFYPPFFLNVLLLSHLTLLRLIKIF